MAIMKATSTIITDAFGEKMPGIIYPKGGPLFTRHNSRRAVI